ARLGGGVAGAVAHGAARAGVAATGRRRDDVSDVLAALAAPARCGDLAGWRAARCGESALCPGTGQRVAREYLRGARASAWRRAAAERTACEARGTDRVPVGGRLARRGHRATRARGASTVDRGGARCARHGGVDRGRRSGGRARPRGGATLGCGVLLGA